MTIRSAVILVESRSFSVALQDIFIATTDRVIPVATTQDAFIAGLIAEKATVDIFLTSGIRMQGQIASADRHCLILVAPNGLHEVLYKKAISTIVPSSGREQRAPAGRFPRQTRNMRQ